MGAAAIDGIDVFALDDKPGAGARAGDVLVVRGWAHHDGAGSLTVVVDGAKEYPVYTRMPRPDVAAALNDPAALDSGFTVSVPTADLDDGEHALAVVAPGPAGRKELARTRFRLSSAGPPAGEPRAHGWLDAWVDEAGTITPIAGPTLHVPPDAVVRIDGWAVDDVGGDAAVAAFALVGNRMVEVAYGFERPDVARGAGEDHRYCGFSVSFPSTYVAGGNTSFRLVLLAADGVTLRHTDIALALVRADCDG